MNGLVHGGGGAGGPSQLPGVPAGTCMPIQLHGEANVAVAIVSAMAVMNSVTKRWMRFMDNSDLM